MYFVRVVRNVIEKAHCYYYYYYYYRSAFNTLSKSYMKAFSNGKRMHALWESIKRFVNYKNHVGLSSLNSFSFLKTSE